MKASYYNHLVSNGPTATLIFNALRHSITEIDSEIAKRIEQNDFAGIDPKTISILKAQGIIVDKLFDEKKYFLINHQKSKYHSDTAEFIILTTYACNLSCPYCYEGHGQKSKLSKMFKKYMDLDTANRTVKFITNWSRDIGVKKIIITLFGGEPMLNIKIGLHIIREIYSFAMNNGIEFNCTAFTNGTLLTLEIINELKKYNFDKPLITLDGSRDYHNEKKVLAKKGTFDLILGNIKLLQDNGLSTMIRINVDRSNTGSIDKLLSEIERSGLKKIELSFKPIHELTNRECKLCGYSDQEFAKFAPTLWEKALKRGFAVANIDIYDSLVYCGNQMTNNLAIDPFGDLYTCLNYVGNTEHRFGNIGDGTANPNFNHVYYDWMSRNPLDLDGCNNCKLLPICAGGCVGQAHNEKGGYHFGHCITEKWLIPELVKLNYVYGKR
ncbi:MAG: radical SAM protein [Parcubacteria group bacterium]